MGQQQQPQQHHATTRDVVFTQAAWKNQVDDALSCSGKGEVGNKKGKEEAKLAEEVAQRPTGDKDVSVDDKSVGKDLPTEVAHEGNEHDATMSLIELSSRQERSIYSSVGGQIRST